MRLRRTPRPRSVVPRARPDARTHKQRGTALLSAMACTLLIVLLGAGVVSTTLLGLHQSQRLRDNTLAFNVAESGAERSVRWLKDQPYPPTNTSPFDPFGGVQALGDGSYQVTITPDPENTSNPLKKYKVLVVGTFLGKTEQVETVLRQQSFGRYAYFTDKEVSSVSGGRIWFISQDRIRGPAHSNNDGGSNFQINWGANPGPIFADMVTAAGPSMNYAPANPTTEPDFLKIYATGSRGYQVGVDPIALPESSDMQKVAAWGGTSGFPSTTGVYVPDTGGVYVRGDSSVQLQVDGGGNQVYRTTQGSNVTTVTIDYTNNRRIRQYNSDPPTYIAGTGTGVFYSSGNITSLSGTIANNRLNAEGNEIEQRSAHTIATDVNGNKNITVSGPIRYQSAPDPALPVNDPVNLRPGTLGLIGRNVIISSSAPASMEIDAICLAGSSSTSDGSFYVSNYSTKTPVGTLKLVGGIVQKGRGPVGTFNPSTQQVVSGYVKNYWYDPRLADNPPPYFPTTGLYDRISWRRLAPG